MLLRGDRIDDVGPDGHNLKDDTFLVLMNALDVPERFVLPHEAAGDPIAWEVIPESAGAVVRGKKKVTDSTVVKPNLMVVFRADRRTVDRRDGNGSESVISEQ
jgi:hypothetical protein